MLKTNTFFVFFHKLSNDMYFISSFTLVQKPLAFELYGLLQHYFLLTHLLWNFFIRIFDNKTRNYFEYLQCDSNLPLLYLHKDSYQSWNLSKYFRWQKNIIFLRIIYLLVFFRVSEFWSTWPVSECMFKIVPYGYKKYIRQSKKIPITPP